MAVNVSKQAGYYPSWVASSLSNLRIYVDGLTLGTESSAIMTWNATYGSGSFTPWANTGTYAPDVSTVDGVKTAYFTPSYLNDNMTYLSEHSPQQFTYGCLAWGSDGTDWKDAMALAYAFDPAQRQISRLEKSGSSISHFTGLSGQNSASVSGNLVTSDWVFAGVRAGGGKLKVFRNGVEGGEVNWSPSASDTYNRTILACNYMGNRHMTVRIGAAFMCSGDIGYRDMERITGFIFHRLGKQGKLSSSFVWKDIAPLQKNLFRGSEVFVSVA